MATILDLLKQNGTLPGETDTKDDKPGRVIDAGNFLGAFLAGDDQPVHEPTAEQLAREADLARVARASLDNRSAHEKHAEARARTGLPPRSPERQTLYQERRQQILERQRRRRGALVGGA